MEVIKHAAVKAVAGFIVLGKSHAECFNKAYDHGVKMSSKSKDQGFYTSKDRYVDRHTGADIAVKAGQVPDNIFILFSEDLWSPKDGGRFKYDSIEGYHE